jgi:hypothetical protein
MIFKYFLALRIRGRVNDVDDNTINIEIKREEAIRIRDLINQCLEQEKSEND